MQQLRAQGYTRTSSRACRPRGYDAGYATAPGDDPNPRPRRSSLGRSLLVASALGASAGAALLAWDYYDPATAAPVKKFAYDTLDAAIRSFHRVRDVTQPYVNQLLGSASSQISALTSSPAAPRSAERVEAATHAAPSLTAGENAKDGEDEEEKRAKIILLEGVKQMREEEDDDDDDEDEVGAVATSDKDAPGTSHTLEKTTQASTHAEKAQPVPAHDATAEIEQKRATDEAELRQRLEAEERKAEAEAEHRREEKRRAHEEAERQEREEAELRKKEREEALDRVRKNIEERKKARAEQHAKDTEEATKREASEGLVPTQEKKEAPSGAEPRKSSSIREHQLKMRREQMDKMRVAAVEAKQKRDEAEAVKRQQSVPSHLLSPHKPDTQHQPTVAHSDGPTDQVKSVVQALAVAEPVPVAERKQSDETDKVQAAIAAAVDKARKEEQEKFGKLMQEKERLTSRIHLLEAENYAAQWQKSMSQAFESISSEMASRKFMNIADFAHLSALFSGYISLKNALDKEQPFTNELRALKSVIHDDLAHHVIDSVPPSAAAGVPTLQRITTMFEQHVVPSVRQVAFTANDSDYPMPVQHIRRTFAWYVLGSLRVKAPSEMTAPDTTSYQAAERVLALTHEALNKGDLMSALQEIRRLPAPVSAIGKNWAQGLHDRLVVEQATTIFDALIPPAK